MVKTEARSTMESLSVYRLHSTEIGTIRRRYYFQDASTIPRCFKNCFILTLEGADYQGIPKKFKFVAIPFTTIEKMGTMGVERVIQRPHLLSHVPSLS